MGQTGTQANIVLGIANISYGGTLLGYTVGDTTITITNQQTDIMVDDFGETPLETYDIGTQITVTVPLTEFSLANLNIAVPGSTLTSDRIKVGRQAGTKLTASKLILIALATGDRNVTIYRAIVSEVGDMIWSNNQRTYEVTFKGLIDGSRPDGDQLFRIGGPSS